MGRMVAGLLLFAMALSPAERAIAYLSREVPAWRGANGCFSCHNNGDGARALYIAGLSPDSAPLAATTEWLTHPERWETNPGNPAVSDKKLARIQFAAALLASKQREGLCQAANLVAADRSAEGSWTVDAGSPATYGTALATHFAQRVMNACGLDTAATAAWFSALRPRSIPDNAALLMAQPHNAAARAFLLGAQGADGGWGEHPGMPAQVFDTALAILALRDGAEATRGRAWLIARQQPEGGWPETTRPPGAQSYAQHISTTAWALLAILPAAP